MNEIWKDIEGYEGLYQVSNIGRVKSLSRAKEKILKEQKCKWGYSRVTLSNPKKHFYTHRLVALTFIPNQDNKSEVNHIDGDKLNNSISNLEWVTPKENSLHAVNNNLRISPKGSNNGRSKLTEKDVVIIRQMLKNGVTQRNIAKKFNVSQYPITQIKLGKTWNHI